MTGQLSRYAVTGVLSNAMLYLVYLCLTGLGGEPKTVMSALYLAGVLLTFAVNRRWTFAYGGPALGSLGRYLTAYAVGYMANLVMLFSLVNLAGWNHRYVQAAAIPCVALLLFTLQRLWVFRGVQRTNDAIV